LRKGAKEHPKLAVHLEDCAKKVKAGVFTAVDIDYTDNRTGKKHLARIDGDDAEEILAARKEEIAKQRAHHRAEHARLEELEKSL
jgi:hypothetical protein